MKPSLRKPLLAFHLWIGLIAGLVLVVVALSGTVLIFRSALERKMDPKRFIVEAAPQRLSLDAMAEAAKAAHPTGALESVRFFKDPTMPAEYLFTTKEYVHIDPHTGKVLGIRQRYGEGFGWVEGIHKYLTLDPDLGENVNGAFAIVFVILFLTGLVLWWPASRKALVAGVTLNWRLKGRPWHLNLHKTFGFYVSLVLLFSALSGIPIALESTRIVLDTLTGSARETAPKASGQHGFVGFQAIADRIEHLTPGASETYIPLPKPTGLVSAYVIASDAPHPNARSYVWYDGASGKRLRYTPFAQATAGYRLYYWMLSLHTAVTGGWVVPMLLMLASLSVPLLFITGTTSYFKRRGARSTVREPAKPLAPQAGSSLKHSPSRG